MLEGFLKYILGFIITIGMQVIIYAYYSGRLNLRVENLEKFENEMKKFIEESRKQNEKMYRMIFGVSKDLSHLLNMKSKCKCEKEEEDSSF